MIDAYLTELAAHLKVDRERVLAEAEDHLREAAAKVGEANAIARFGPPELVAARVHSGIARWDARRSVVTVVVAGIVLFTGFFAISLFQPRAPWSDAELPWRLWWTLTPAMVAGQTSIAAGAIAVIWRYLFADERLAADSAAVVLVAAMAATVSHLAYTIDRLTQVHGSTTYVVAASAGASAMVATALAATVLTWRRRARVRAASTHSGRVLLRGAWLWCGGVALMAGVSVFAHAETTFRRSLLDGAVESTAVIALFALLSRRLGLAAPREDAGRTARRTRQ